MNNSCHDKPLTATRWMLDAALALLLSLPITAHASLFEGETLDAVADGAAWVVLVVAPIIAIGIFLLVHILPEKIAEQKKHPQAKAIQTLCILSLFFGGLLWPLAWLWAYSKPVFYKMAYGTDSVEHGEQPEAAEASPPDDAEELRRALQRIAELEARLDGESAEPGQA